MPLLTLPLTPPTGTPPSNTAAPVASGTLLVGSSVTCTTGTWTTTGTTSYAYQWQDSPDGVTFTDIPSATTSTYVIGTGQLGDFLQCVVTATDTVGSVSTDSNSLGPVTANDPAFAVATAQDVPNKYDIVINSQGYLLLDALTPNIPFRSHRGIYTYTPTFVERLNVQGSFGDNQQAFWLTSSQNDWSLGEGQHFFRGSDTTSRRMYWRGENIDITAEGQARLMGAASQVTFAAAVGGATRGTANAICVSTSNLYDVDSAGTITDNGAHGATISDVSIAALTTDGANIYISGDSGHIRKYNGSAFSDFSATVADSMCFVDNTLWGASGSTLSYYSTSGTASTAFAWKTADGSTTQFGAGIQIKPYGGQVIVLRPGVGVGPGELWTADATGAKQVAEFPAMFSPRAMAVVNGIVFVVGHTQKKNYGYRCEVWYYANGNIGRLYASECYQNLGPASAITEHADGFAFIDGPNRQVMAYDLTGGSVSTIMDNSTFPNPRGSRFWLAQNNNGGLLLTADVATGVVLPGSSAATSGKLISSQHDFDSSLTKLFRGITVDWTAGTDGDGGSVDIAYKINNTDIGPLDLTYTTLQTGAESGVEYPLSSTGNTLSVQVTLNKGSSTNGPTVKRVYVRAAPELQTFRKREYILDLTGAPPDPPRLCRDGSPYVTIPHDGVENLISAATGTIPISITDRFGTFNGIIEPDGFEVYEMHAQNQIPTKSGSFVVKVTVREI